MNNGSESLKKQAINKAKQVASSAVPTSNGNGKKRRKQDLKPIITTENQQNAAGNPYRYVAPCTHAKSSLSSFPVCTAHCYYLLLVFHCWRWCCLLLLLFVAPLVIHLQLLPARRRGHPLSP